MKTRYIYHVLDDAGHVRYVGCSTNPYRRLLSHSYDAAAAETRGRGVAFRRWLGRQMVTGRPTAMMIVKIASDDWAVDEQDEIARLRDGGSPLLNLAVRGQPRGPITHGYKGSPTDALYGVAQAIRQKREALGLTLVQAAKAAGMNGKQAWHAIEAGTNKNVTLATLKAMARVLKCKAGDLIDE